MEGRRRGSVPSSPVAEYCAVDERGLVHHDCKPVEQQVPPDPSAVVVEHCTAEAESDEHLSTEEEETVHRLNKSLCA
jgi:hypothetical protein